MRQVAPTLVHLVCALIGPTRLEAAHGRYQRVVLATGWESADAEHRAAEAVTRASSAEGVAGESARSVGRVAYGEWLTWAIILR